MFDVCQVEHICQSGVDGAVGAYVHGVSFNDPEQRCQDLVHALSVADARMHLTPDEQYIQHHILRCRLAEVDVVRHASFDVLKDLGAQGFVCSEG